MATLVSCVGSPVTGGERFWDRESEITRFVEMLDAGNSILLIAQRRIGKTSLMREVAERISDRYICLQVDLEADQSPADMVASLAVSTKPHAGPLKRVSTAFSNILGTAADRVDTLGVGDLSLKFRDGLVGQNWEAKGRTLFEILASAKKPVVIFLDEVPILVNRLLTGEGGEVTPEGKRRAEVLLSWLRECTQRHSDKIRLVVTGSIGLAPILQRTGLSATINHLAPFDLPPWDEATACGCLDALADGAGVTLEEGVRDAMVERLGRCVPHHLQMYFSAALDVCRRHGPECHAISAADAAVAYNQTLLGIRGLGQLSHYEERLHRGLGDHLFTVAVGVLTAVAVRGPSSPADVARVASEYATADEADGGRVREVLQVLQHDGYLEFRDGRYHFVSNLLRDWWSRHFGSLLPSTEGG